MDNKEVRLLKETKIAPDGIHARIFKVDSIVSLPATLADALVRDKKARLTAEENTVSIEAAKRQQELDLQKQLEEEAAKKQQELDLQKQNTSQSQTANTIPGARSLEPGKSGNGPKPPQGR